MAPGDTKESVPPAVPIDRDQGSRSIVRTLVLMIATATAIALCYLVAAPFLPALAWAAALAILLAPLQHWLESRLKCPTIAALASVLMVGVIVIVATTFVGQRLILQAAKGGERIETQVKSGEWRRALETQPRLAALFERVENHLCCRWPHSVRCRRPDPGSGHGHGNGQRHPARDVAR